MQTLLLMVFLWLREIINMLPVSEEENSKYWLVLETI